MVMVSFCFVTFSLKACLQPLARLWPGKRDLKALDCCHTCALRWVVIGYHSVDALAFMSCLFL
jgi:hypothetical protein